MSNLRLRVLAALMIVPLLAACEAASLIGGLGEPSSLYTLTPKNTFDTGPRVDWQLVVEEPYAAGGLNNARIALRTAPTKLDYFALALWTDRAPRMVQTLLVESFENSGRIVAVGRQAIGLRSDFNLKSELREFQAEYQSAGKAPVVRVRLNAKVIKQPSRAIIASENFEATIPAASNAMPDIIRAFDDAMGKVLKRIVEWTLAQASATQ
jgi:cholesterol transport system auxiliary component